MHISGTNTGKNKKIAVLKKEGLITYTSAYHRAPGLGSTPLCGLAAPRHPKANACDANDHVPQDSVLGGLLPNYLGSEWESRVSGPVSSCSRPYTGATSAFQVTHKISRGLKVGERKGMSST